MDNNITQYNLEMQKLIQEFNSLNFGKNSCIKPLEEIYDKDQQSLVINNQENELDEQNLSKNMLNDETQSHKIKEENKVNTCQQKQAQQYINNECQYLKIQFNKDIQLLTIKKYFTLDNQKQFENEVEIITLLKDYQITLPLVKYGQEDSKYYYEQIAGQKDFLMLQKSQLRLEIDGYKEIINCFFQKLFNKLEKLHQLGYAHSCIKPQNIVLYENEPYFIDFGGCVQLDDYKNYLNYLTPMYNLNKYYEKLPNGIIQKKYQFTNKEEVKECERTQLALSFMYVSRCTNAQLQTDFKLKKYSKLYLSGLQDILQTLIEKPDQYHTISNQIFKQTITDDQFNQTLEYLTDILYIQEDDNNIKTQIPVIKRLNQYSLTMIDVLVEKYGHIRIQAQHSDIYIVSLSLKYRMLYTILYYYYSFQNLNEIIQKNLIVNININKNTNFQSQLQDTQVLNQFITQNSYQQQLTSEMLSQENEYIYDLNIEYLEKNSAQLTYNDTMQLNFLKILKERYLTSQKTNKLINKIDLLVNKITKQVQKQQLKDILIDCSLLAQQKILDKLLFHTKYPIHHICKYFRSNKFTVTFYKLIFNNLDFFKQIDGFCQQKIDFEIRFVNCSFSESLISEMVALMKSNPSRYSFSFQQSNCQSNCLNKVQFQSSKQKIFDQSKQNENHIQYVFVEESASNMTLEEQNTIKEEKSAQEMQKPHSEEQESQLDSKKIISEIINLFENCNSEEECDPKNTDKQFNTVFKKSMDSLLVSLRKQLKLNEQFDFLFTGKQVHEILITQLKLDQSSIHIE